jgi:hypothetical protein
MGRMGGSRAAGSRPLLVALAGSAVIVLAGGPGVAVADTDPPPPATATTIGEPSDSGSVPFESTPTPPDETGETDEDDEGDSPGDEGPGGDGPGPTGPGTGTAPGGPERPGASRPPGPPPAAMTTSSAAAPPADAGAGPHRRVPSGDSAPRGPQSSADPTGAVAVGTSPAPSSSAEPTRESGTRQPGAVRVGSTGVSASALVSGGQGVLLVGIVVALAASVAAGALMAWSRRSWAHRLPRPSRPPRRP